ncbi:DMT family transporter [Paenibacillus xylaniclasticus]|uniref:DMT family transporter n=1 Tax=Paenibacillus xylaniclasticus TaxID=588083 RepID=UPI000FDBF50C|nr:MULTISPECIES: DMT family transporter [Paenibacillus]GFN33124.1 membrane protein [Paenibacillus curdlanolyticus]
MANKGWAYTGLAGVAAIWGINFGVSRLAMDTFDPVVFAFLRFGLAVPLFFLVLYLKEGSVGVLWRDAAKLALIGLFGVTLLEILVMYSIKYTTLANASLLNVAPWPIFAALFAPLFTKESFTRRIATGGMIAIAGVSLVILGGGEGLNLSSDNMKGNLMAFSISLLGALFNLSCMPLMKRYSALRVTAWFSMFGSLFMFPITIGSWGTVDWKGLTATDYGVLAFGVLLCTFISFLTWNAAMYRVGAARSNFFRYVVPAAAVITGYIMFDEQITLWQIGGGIVMAAGLIWISAERKSAAVEGSAK